MLKLLNPNCIVAIYGGEIQCNDSSSPCPKDRNRRVFGEDCFSKPHQTTITIGSLTSFENHIETLKVSTQLSNSELRQIIRAKLGETCAFI